MAFRSGVFTSTSVTVNGDGIPVGNKAITAADFAKRFYHIYGDGISLKPTSAFYVKPKSGLIATVSAGWGMMSGYDFEETEDYDITMTSSTSDQTLYIGVRLDVVTGEFTDNHVAARTTFVAATDRVFAIIVIPANAVTLTTAMITDTRYSTTYCGTLDSQRIALADLHDEYEDALAALALTEASGIEAVSYGAAQTLSAGEKAQALANIGAAALENGVVKASQAKVLIEVISGDFTLTAARSEKLLAETSSSASVVTLPKDSSIEVGAAFTVVRIGAGTVTFSAESGMTIASPNDVVAISVLYASAVAIKLNSTTWWLVCG